MRFKQKQIHSVKLDAIHLGIRREVKHGIKIDARLSSGTAFADQSGPHGIVKLGIITMAMFSTHKFAKASPNLAKIADRGNAKMLHPYDRRNEAHLLSLRHPHSALCTPHSDGNLNRLNVLASTNNPANLCLECGLCCNGVIFADVRLQAGEDATALRNLGLSVSRNKFSQPCSAF